MFFLFLSVLRRFPAIPKGISVQQKNGLLFRKI
jgi:hypothetical protein